VELTLISEDTRPQLLNRLVFIEGTRIVVTIPTRGTGPNLSSDALTTTLLVKGLPLDHSQTLVTVAFHHFLGVRNVIAVTYNRAQEDALGRHNGIATLRCLNFVIYSHWVNHGNVPLLGRLVEFVPHRRSLASSLPNFAARQHDNRPARERLWLMPSRPSRIVPSMNRLCKTCKL
jgi:hypothetical protein